MNRKTNNNIDRSIIDKSINGRQTNYLISHCGKQNHNNFLWANQTLLQAKAYVLETKGRIENISKQAPLSKINPLKIAHCLLLKIRSNSHCLIHQFEYTCYYRGVNLRENRQKHALYNNQLVTKKMRHFNPQMWVPKSMKNHFYVHMKKQTKLKVVNSN